MLPLHHHGTERMCAGSERRGKKNGGTEVPPFPLQGLSGFPDRNSPLKRVPNRIRQDVGARKQKMTAPKCRHFHRAVYLVSQIAFRHLKEYRKPIVRKTLEIYGVDEGSRTPGLQDHNLAL